MGARLSFCLGLMDWIRVLGFGADVDFGWGMEEDMWWRELVKG